MLAGMKTVKLVLAFLCALFAGRCLQGIMLNLMGRGDGESIWFYVAGLVLWGIYPAWFFLKRDRERREKAKGLQ
jgi:hypothetical protein